MLLITTKTFPLKYCKIIAVIVILKNLKKCFCSKPCDDNWNFWCCHSTVDDYYCDIMS